MPSLIAQIAQQFSPRLPGVDWNALEHRFGMHRDELVYHSDISKPPDDTGVFAYDKYISLAMARAEIQLARIQLSFQVKDSPATQVNDITIAMRAWDRAQKEAITVGDETLRLLERGVRFFDSDEEYLIKIEDYRALISSTYVICLYGALIHAKKLMQFEDFNGRDIVEHADMIVKTLNGLALLGETGALDVLQPRALGVTVPATIAIVAISAVFVVGFICYASITMQEAARYNDLVKTVCEESIASGDPAAIERCEGLVRLNKVGTEGPLANTAQSLASASMTIAISLIALMAAPSILRAFSKRTKQ